MTMSVALIMFVGSLVLMSRSSSAFRTSATSSLTRTVSRSLSAKEQTGHMAPSTAPQLSPEEEQAVAAFRENQGKAARISFAEEVRTLISKSNHFGVMSTNSNNLQGYPAGSVVGFQVNDEGMPFFVFSSMSSHTTDVLKDSRCSLTILSDEFKGAAEGRVALVGDVKKVFDKEQIKEMRAKYLEYHKDAFWVDFGDFTWFTMTELKSVRFVGGFAMAGNVTPEEYKAAQPDPLAPFAGHVIGHMNDDHSDATAAMVKHYVGVDCTDAKIVGMDRLGLTVKATLTLAGGGVTKVRVPFPREVTERKMVKDVIVEMTQASASAVAGTED
jgi:putative heme iron utilization protein